MNRVDRWLSRRSNLYMVGVSLAVLAAVFLLDVLTGIELSFSIFYLIPVALVAWFTTRRSALLVSLLAGAAWFASTQIEEGADYSNIFVPLWNAVVRLTFFFVAAYLMSSLRRMLDTERELARIDSLTGAANTRHFSELAQIELSKGQRYRRPLTVAYLDVDDFKSINDNLGHGAGDVLLRTVADTLRSSLRTSDVVGRLGGDEFGILLPETDSEAADAVLMRVQSRLATALDEPSSVTFSIGAATYVSLPESVDEMVREADRLMYIAKHEGKNSLRHAVLEQRDSVDLVSEEAQT